MKKEYDITPVPKPRMTRADKFSKRDVVQRYWDFKKEVRVLKMNLENENAITFILPIPKSWSKKKQAQMNGQPHQQKPDIDNLLKAVLDAIYDDDCAIYKLNGLAKYWGESGKIIVEV